MVFELIALMVGLVILTRGAVSLFFLERSLVWYRKNYRNDNNIKGKLPRIVIIIPVLREQKRIIETLKYFLKSFGKYPIKIVVATTNREFEKKFNGLSTQRLVENYIQQNSLKEKISLINYPKKYGKKAHQLNYVLEILNDKTDYIAVYDADSRPHKLTFDVFYQQMKLYPEAEVFQQSALFVNNYNKISNFFLRASAILQSRWTLAHEVARLLRQSGKETIVSKLVNAHCVGHGLIISLKMLKIIGGFPEETMNEDLIIGYLLRVKGVKIFPLPCLELADAPTTLLGLWNQKYVWFWGPLRYVEYYRFACKKYNLDLRSRIKAMVLVFQGLISALAWLLSGPLFLVALILVFFVDSVVTVVVLILAVVVYGPAQFVVTVDNFEEYQEWSGQKLKKQNLSEIIETALMSVPAILFNSIPPYFALFSEIRYRFQNTEIYKPKTDD